MKNYYVLVESVAGSRLYGTHRPDSDTDLRGVCLAPIGSIIGLDTPFEQHEEKQPHDRIIWELRKFVHLALNCNPNILDTLFCPPRLWSVFRSEWNDIYDCRHSVLSQEVRKTYAGYATSQLKRIEGHRKWLLDPPPEPDVNEYGSYRGTSVWKWNSLLKADEYRKLHKEWTHYKDWLENRNPARAELERSFGYDCKHGSHLIRLLVQGRTILVNGDFSPVLEGNDRTFVLSVLHGEWTYDQLIDEATRRFDEIRAIPSTLPERSDPSVLNELIQFIYKRYIREAA